MATTKIWDIKGRLDQVVDYATNPNKTVNPDFNETDLQGLRDVMDYATDDFKTEKQFYVSGINCDPEFARNQMIETKMFWKKTDSIIAFHGYQSFVENEVTAETAHKVGIELAKQIWGDRFEVLVATHLNTNHFHNHFVVNSVSFKDGLRYYDNNKSYMLLRHTSDEVCKEFGLSVIENPQRGKTKHYAEIRAEREGKSTWRSNIRNDIDRAIEQSTTTRHFWEEMEAMGYEIKNNVKYLAVRPQGHTKFFRLYKLGDNYAPEAIKERILRNIRRKFPLPEEVNKPKSYRFNGNMKKAKKLTGLRALYFHYCFILGIFPKSRASNKRMHFLLRDDLIKFDSIIAQSKLLCENRIDTHEQLAIYKSSVEEKIQTLTETRLVFRNQLKCLVRSNDEANKIEVEGQIAGVSTELKKLRTESKLCDGISTRSAQMKENLKQVKLDEIKQREEKKDYEHIRRSGRPNR
jgi:hypothetical protein